MMGQPRGQPALQNIQISTKRPINFRSFGFVGTAQSNSVDAT